MQDRPQRKVYQDARGEGMRGFVHHNFVSNC
jgi:hypothetical protein